MHNKVKKTTRKQWSLDPEDRSSCNNLAEKVEQIKYLKSGNSDKWDEATLDGTREVLKDAPDQLDAISDTYSQRTW